MSKEILIENLIDYECAKLKLVENNLSAINYCWMGESRVNYVAHPVSIDYPGCYYLIKRCACASIDMIELSMTPQEILDTLQFELKRLGYLELFTLKDKEAQE